MLFSQLASDGTPFPIGESLGMTMAMDRAPTMPPPTMASRELAPLFEAMAAGDRSALATLYKRTSAKLFGIIVRIVGNTPDAEEVLQEVFVAAWRNAGRYDRSRASSITWLGVIARNRAVDRLRARRPDAAPIDAAADVADDSPLASDLLVSAEEGTRLRTCLDELEDRARAMIEAAFLDGATYSQLAERHDVPLGTMKSWIRRGLQRLKGCLER